MRTSRRLTALKRNEIALSVILALIGFGISAGQEFALNVWVVGFWAAAVLLGLWALFAPHSTGVAGSLRAHWLREAEAFDALAERDHYHLSPGEAMPGGISKVYADYGDGRWFVCGGLTDGIRKDVEIQCRASGQLLRHSKRSRPAEMHEDDLQAWIQFVADSGEITDTVTFRSADGTEWESPGIGVLTVASARACRRCAAVEPPAEGAES